MIYTVTAQNTENEFAEHRFCVAGPTASRAAADQMADMAAAAGYAQVRLNEINDEEL